MDRELSIEEEDVGWRSRRERMNNALAAARTAEQQDPAKVYSVAHKLGDVINGANVEEFISMIERLADQAHPSAIVNFQGYRGGSSLLHIVAHAGRVDILGLLVDYVRDHLIAAQDDWGNTPLHIAAKAGESRAAAMLIHRARDLPDLILRMRNKHGNTALHEAVLNCHVNMVHLLLREDLEPVYWENLDKKSPLYLALDTGDSTVVEVLLSLSLEPLRMQGLPLIHGAILRSNYGLIAEILKKNMKLFAMTDFGGSNVFHLAAYRNQGRVFEFLLPETEYLARERDTNGDLPIHIASKMGHVALIEKLHRVSHLLNRRGQTVLHVAAKYGRTSVVRYILKHPELGKLINERDYAGNTPLHLAAMHSQPASLFPLVQDERIQPVLLNHKCSTALEIALDCMRREYRFRKLLAVMVLATKSNPNLDLLLLKPETRDEALSTYRLNKKRQNMDRVKDVTNTRLLVATLVATVTFAAGFTVPGGFNSSDMASKDDRGMATMADKRMFQAFIICNTIATFFSMTAVVNVIWTQQKDEYGAITAYQYTKLPLKIALPAMFAAFFTGVTLTVGKLPWLANSIFYWGLVFLLIILRAIWCKPTPFFLSQHRPIRLLMFWFVLTYVLLWGIKTYPLADLEEDGTASGTSASKPSDGDDRSND